VGPVEEVGPLGKTTARAVLEHLARGPELSASADLEDSGLGESAP
jgi:hypothetical protein